MEERYERALLRQERAEARQTLARAAANDLDLAATGSAPEPPLERYHEGTLAPESDELCFCVHCVAHRARRNAPRSRIWEREGDE